ncbi:MAG: AMP-binding protein [Deltaproteobacteria bacterium]|nr:AMP-binding protein [Deltaproteobacteria bacterium]
MLIHDVLTRNARICPDRVALAMGRETITYRDLSARVSVAASALRKLGVAKGDRVALLTRTPPLYVELFYAVTGIGAVLVPLNDLLVRREIEAILAHAEASVLLFAAEFRDMIDRIRPGLPSAARFACVDQEVPGYDALDRNGEGSPGFPVDAATTTETDIAIQVYTSGIYGSRRGAMLSHRNLLAASASAAMELGLSRNDVTLSCMPMPFMAGTGRLLRFQYLGGTVVLLREFDPEEVLQAIERRKITHLLLTPTMMARILDLPTAGRYNLATLRTVLYGGASIPVELQKRAIRFFRCDMVQSYGHVESSGVLTFLQAEDHSLEESAPYMRKLMSVGKEAIGVEVRVVTEGGAEIAPNQVGEIVARGPNIFEGYFRDPASTAEVMRNGWLYTGDIASVDEDGYIYIVDRKRDTLIVGGIPICPREIEDVLAEHPAVKEAAVIGRPDYVFGEVPVAVIERKEGADTDEETILSHCRENMAPFKVPVSVEFVPRLPRNSQGKVLKAKLKDKPTPRTPRR